MQPQLFLRNPFVFICISLVMYLYIYGPPFKVLPVNISLLLCLIPYLILLRNRDVISLCMAEFKIEIILFVVIAIYSIAVSFHGGVEHFFYFPLVFAFLYLPMSVWLFLFVRGMSCRVERNQFNDIVFLLSVCSIAASVISIFMFLNQSLAEFIKFEVLKYDKVLLRYQSHRGFAIADELLFSFSIVQAMICLIYIRCFKVGKYSVILFILTIISILLNARIGFLFMLLLPFLIPRSYFFKLFKIFTFFTIVIYFVFSSGLLETNSEIDFLSTQFSYFFSDLFQQNNGKGNTANALLNMMHTPNSIGGLIFGTGENIFFSTSNNSDVGYILFLYYGGVIFIGFILLFFIFAFARLYKAGISKALIAFLLFVVAIAQIKGVFIEAKPGMRLFILIYVNLILCNKMQKYKVTS